MKDTKIKERFFALYWGQFVLYDEYAGPWEISCDTIDDIEHHYIELRDIFNLSNEEYAHIAMTNYGEAESYIGKNLIHSYKGSYDRLPACVCEYLRQISVALPFAGMSVDEQIEKEWVRIK